MAVETLITTGADNVGGVQQAIGTSATGRAVAAAMTSRFGVGDARFHYGGEAGPADTVYLGVFRRSALERVGGFDESLIRNQDYELNWRLRASGGTVFFDPRLVVAYTPRQSFARLAEQYYEYGRWKREVIRRDPRSIKARQLAAPATVVLVTAGLARGGRALLLPAAYVTGCIAATAGQYRAGLRGGALPRLPIAFVTMHFCWGFGFLNPLAVKTEPSLNHVPQAEEMSR
jgi:hypothetical protein